MSQYRRILDSLTVYRDLLDDEVCSALRRVLGDLTDPTSSCDQFMTHYGEFFHALVERTPDLSLRSHLIRQIVYADNAFSRQAQSSVVKPRLRNAAERDLSGIGLVASITVRDIKDAAAEKYKDPVVEDLPDWEVFGESGEGDDLFSSDQDWRQCLDSLIEFHHKNGVGQFARFKGFVWAREGGVGLLRGIPAPDPVRFTELIGYEREREIVIENTRQLMGGSPANNILLYGDRGTGKSSTVKALLNEFGHLGLRLIELPGVHLHDLPSVLSQIRDLHQKFIIFVDDLTLDDHEHSYTALKAVLEGGLEIRPRHVVIYATSNRRHLVKERFSDRWGLGSISPDDEVRSADTVQEKLSLADRFGITVTFSSPDQKRYLEIVRGLAEMRGLSVDLATLHREALQWEIQYNGRSPRTARQFVDWLEGRIDGPWHDGCSTKERPQTT